MDVFVYYTHKLPCGRDTIEDDLEEILGERGSVTGGGAGVSGGNIDLEVTDESLAPDHVLEMVRQAFRRNGAYDPSIQVVINGERRPL